MIKIKSKEQIEAPGLEAWRNDYSPKKIALLEKSWAGTFRHHILPNLPVDLVKQHYSNSIGRNTKELYAIMGVVVFQECFDLTDNETIEELAFNQQWHYALDCFEEKDQITSLRTLWTMRKYISEEKMADSIFALSTDEMIKALGIDISKQRLDSVHVYSNMAKIGRIRILLRSILKFLKNLKKKDSILYNSILTEELKKNYLKKNADSCFSQIKPSSRDRNLQSLAEDMYSLIKSFQNNKKVSRMNSFKLLCRVFNEQCTADNQEVKVRKPKEVPSDSIQNPSDEDAGFDGHKGQGYQSQLMETYQTEAEKNACNHPKPDMITYSETESADKHDSYALEPAIKEVTERGHRCDELLADAAYGGTKNTEKAAEYGVKLISPTLGRTSEKRHESFEYNHDNYEVTSCPAGNKPDELKHNKASITAIWYPSTCEDCPLASECPTKECKKGRKHYYTISSMKCHFRREYEKSKSFKDQYRYRSGIEATNSRFISMTGGRRSRYRCLEKMRFSQKLKALAINMFRVAKYLRELPESVYFSKLKSFFSHFPLLRGQKFVFSA